MRAGESYSQEFRYRLKDGTLRWIKDDVTVQVAGEGLWNVVGVMTDITAQKQAEEDTLHLMTGAHCLLWHAMVEDTPSPHQRLAWQLHVVNEEAAAHFFPVMQAPDQSYTSAWNASRLDEEWGVLHERSTQAILQSQSYSQEFRSLHRDGTIRWHQEDVHVEALTPGRWRAIGVCTDITERKYQEGALQEREQHFRLALAGGNLGSWHVDFAAGITAGKFIQISDRTKGFFGISPHEDFSWDYFIKAIVVEDQRTVFTTILNALRHQTNTSVEYRILLPDGTLRWLGSHGHTILDSQGKATQLIGVTRDITERKLIEQERVQALQEAQERADRDPLTNLLNHREFYKRLEEECARARREDTSLAVVMLDLDNFKFFNDVYGHMVGDHVLCQVAQRLQETCRVYDTLSRFGGDEFALILPNIGLIPLPEVEARLKTNLKFSFQPEGYQSPIPITISIGAALYPKGEQDWHDIIHLADARLLHAKTGGATEREADLTRAHMSEAVEGFSMLDALVTAVDNKDRYTKRHSEDVMTYSLQLARALGASESLQRTIAAAALLHDVGKIGVPDAILRKPGRLTEAEFAAIRLHPTMGAAIVGAVVGLESTLDAVRYHHERWDGRGYPEGTRERETPWIARLMAVADAFSAMTTDRPYRQGMPTDRALTILDEGAGTQWDPEMVAAFAACQNQVVALKRAA